VHGSPGPVRAAGVYLLRWARLWRRRPVRHLPPGPDAQPRRLPALRPSPLPRHPVSGLPGATTAPGDGNCAGRVRRGPGLLHAPLEIRKTANFVV